MPNFSKSVRHASASRGDIRDLPIEQEIANPEFEHFLAQCLCARAFDQRLFSLARQGKIGTYTPVRGQEAGQVAVAQLLEADDWLVPTFRGAAAQLVRGEPLERLFLFHLGFEEGNVHQIKDLPIAAPVASQIPHAVGLALHEKLANSGHFSAVFFGDGAIQKGDFHEALNFAAVQRIPTLFICENNRWALSTPLEKHTAAPNFFTRALGYGCDGYWVDGRDAVSVYLAVQACIEQIHQNGAPVMLEIETERSTPHSHIDNPAIYGCDTNASEDAVEKLRDQALATGAWSLGQEERLLADFDLAMNSAWEKAQQMAKRLGSASRRQHQFGPALLESPQETVANNTSRRGTKSAQQESEPLEGEIEGKKCTMVQAVNMGLREILAGNPDALMLGQDIGRLGGVFRATQDLQKEFGSQRIIDTPIAESGITGVCVGLALAGRRPICEYQFSGFAYPAYDQLHSHVARFAARKPGQVSMPILFRAPYGAGVKAPESHSDSIEALFAAVPSLQVVIPSSPRLARALLHAAYQSGKPTVFLEHMALYRGFKEIVPDEIESHPIGKARVLQQGSDLTVVTYGASVKLARRAQQRLHDEGVSLEIIDLLTIKPYDLQTIIKSVRKTQRLIVLHEGVRGFDVGAEIISCLHELGVLPSGAAARITGGAGELPFHGHQADWLPSLQEIVRAARRLVQQKHRQDDTDSDNAADTKAKASVAS